MGGFLKSVVDERTALGHRWNGEIKTKGLKKHTHAERQTIIGEMTPLIKKRFGDNLIALAASGSYARNEDADYSDLELEGFVKKMPRGKKFGGFAKIYDGMLIEMMWSTRETYLEHTLEPNEEWYLSGSDHLLPIFNKKFIDELNDYRVENLRKKCLDLAVGHFPVVLENSGKLLNAIDSKNRDGVPLLILYTIQEMLTVLAYLNQKPYLTSSRMISEARELPIKPKTFDELLDIAVKGEYTQLAGLRRTAVAVFTEFEAIFEGLGLRLYDDDFDPNKPVQKHRRI